MNANNQRVINQWWLMPLQLRGNSPSKRVLNGAEKMTAIDEHKLIEPINNQQLIDHSHYCQQTIVDSIINLL